jgi:hypothetical protein
MSNQIWALLGVAVGAGLGALAQLVFDSLRRRHEKMVAMRIERRDAYTELLAAVTSALGPLAMGRAVFERRYAGEQEDEGASATRGGNTDRVVGAPTSHDLDALGNVGGALNRMTLAGARIELLAPSDTVGAAVAFRASAMRFMFRDEDGMVEDFVRSQTDFLELAKRDLELGRRSTQI